MSTEVIMRYRNETVEKIAGKKEFVWINPNEIDYSEYEKNFLSQMRSLKMLKNVL